MNLKFKILSAILMVCLAQSAFAQWAVIDGANLANSAKQVAAWSKQFKQMQDQFTQQKAAFDSMNGSRGMANLVNNPALRGYLPADYQKILNSGYGSSANIRETYKRYGVENTRLDQKGDAATYFNQSANQAAINRATAEEGYRQASNRFADIQVLLDKVNNSPDPKAIADLQARIQAEQAMLQNENAKLAMMAQLAQAQKDLQAQQATEIRMKSSQGNIPRF